MNNTYILSSPIQSGKTTHLMKKFSDRNDVDGFLCPDINGKRHLFLLKNKIFYPLESDGGEKANALINIGKYQFKSDTFKIARTILEAPISENTHYFIVDEIGRLELMGRGFEPALTYFLEKLRSHSSTVKLILVVREGLIESVIQKYQLKDYRIINISDLKTC